MKQVATRAERFVLVLIALLAFAIAVSPVYAGTVTVTVVGDASVGTKTKTYTASDADINRLVAWAKTNYATTAVPNPTTAQALVAMADAWIAALKAAVQSAEKSATIAAVPDPTWTAN